MRISTSMSFMNFISQQQQLQRKLVAEQLQLSTGRAIILPSDSPVQASRFIQLTEIEESQTQILENINHASTFLNEVDSALSEATDLMNRAYELSSSAVSSIAIPEERQAAAIEVDSIIQELSTIANRQFLGLYLFGGRDVNQRPLLDELGGLHYVGDTGELRAKLAEARDEEFNLTLDDAFIMLSERVRGTVDLNPAVTMATRTDELLGANSLGVRTGSLVFTESDGTTERTFNVDLTQANTVEQIINEINLAAAAAGSTLTAGINDAQNGLLITPGTQAVTISSEDNGAIASDLGIITNSPTTDPIVGADLNRLVTNNALIADLNGGLGIDFTDNTFTITNGPNQVTVDLSTAETIQDIINTINNLEVGARASINDDGTGIDVLNEVSGTLMTIEENGGTAATELGIRSLSESTAIDSLNFGSGVRRVEGQDDIEIVAKDGVRFSVNFDTAESVQDVLDLINDAATTAGAGIVASMSPTTNGIMITDTTGGAQVLQLNRTNDSFALDDLGLGVAIDILDTDVTGEDIGQVRVDGVFTGLLDLREALTGDSVGSIEDEQAITDAAQRIFDALNHVSRIRGQVGAQVRAIEKRQDLTKQAVDATTTLLSEVRDLDYTEAITKFQQTQTALQASLLASGQAINVSLLNFLS